MKYIIIICGAIFLGIISNLLIFVFSRLILSNNKILIFLKNKNLIMEALNIILALSNFLAVFIIGLLFKEFHFTGVIFSVILYILFIFKNIFSRINHIKNNLPAVKLLMPDPENYSKSNDFKKEYWRLFSEIAGLLLGVII